MQVQVHIGFHKTGTTAQQNLLKANAALLPSGTEVRARDDASIAPLREALRSLNADRTAETIAAAEKAAVALFCQEKAAGTAQLLLASVGACGAIPRPDRGKGTIYANVTPAIETLQRASASVGVTLGLSASIRNEKSWTDSLYRHHLRNRGLRMTPAEFTAGPFGQFRFDALITRLRQTAPDLFVFSMEDDIAHRLGVGVSLLRHLGVSEAELATWQPISDRNRGIGGDTVAYLNQPLLRRLPAPLRVALARRHAAKGEHRK